MRLKLKKRGLPKRRKLEGKTNYKDRLAYIKSGKARVVIRLSNKNVVVQFVQYHTDGDKVLITINSKTLEKKYGWKSSRKNIPAAYLTGIIAGKEAMVKGIKEAIADVGLMTPKYGSKFFGALKGVIEAGVKVPHDAKVFPKDEKLEGLHLKNKINVKEIKEKILK